MPRRSLVGFLFVLPSLVLVGVFFVWPLTLVGWMSLHNWPLFGRVRWLGATNYALLLEDMEFWRALRFTVEYTLILTPILFVCAFGLALLADSTRRGVAAARTVWFLPTAIGIGTASVLWVWMLNGDVGIFSRVARELGITSGPLPYLDSTAHALAAACSMVVWKTVGFNMVLLLVGLQAIPQTVKEAALLDGASGLQRLRWITIPLMRRSFALALVLSVTGSLLAFDQFYIITRGGPQNGTITLVYWIYHNAFVSYRLGYASAMSIALLAIVLAINVAQLVALRGRRGAEE